MHAQRSIAHLCGPASLLRALQRIQSKFSKHHQLPQFSRQRGVFKHNLSSGTRADGEHFIQVVCLKSPSLPNSSQNWPLNRQAGDLENQNQEDLAEPDNPLVATTAQVTSDLRGSIWPILYGMFILHLCFAAFSGRRGRADYHLSL